MQRIAIALVVGLATWMGSLAVAEAQTPTITTTGPMAIHPGAPSTTYTANVNLTSASGFYFKLLVLKNGTQVHNMTYWVPNPQSTFMVYSRPVDLSCTTVTLGDYFQFQATIGVGGKWYPATNFNYSFNVTLPPTPPPGTSFKRTRVTSQPAPARFARVDRRREE